MSIQTYKYQQAAIDDVVGKAKRLLARRRSGTKPFSLLLRAPTGAGKTVMMSSAINRVVDEVDADVAFLWLAPYSLHVQSYERIREACEEQGTVTCVLLEEMSIPEIPAGTIAFVNWASISGDKKTLRKEQETGKSLAQFVEQTKAAGTKVVVVIDESHHSLSGKEAQLVLNTVIVPDLIIEVTATPQLTNHDETVTVYREDVVAEEVIRKAISVNPGIGQGAEVANGSVQLSESGTKEAILDAALAMRAKLLEAYKAEGSKVNPLVLVQLPDSGSVPEDVKEELERHLLVRHNITDANGKLAVWLSEEKRHIKGVEKADSPVEVLFFKQGIALGWDCPRAQVLVSLREMKSPSFTSQVLGRILRQPERKAYPNDLLNFGYVFLNHESFSISKEMDSIQAKATMSLRERTTVHLPNHFRLSHDSEKKLKRNIVAAVEDRIKLDVSDLAHRGAVATALVADAVIEDVDSELRFKGTAHGESLGAAGLQKQLDVFIAELIQGTADQLKGKKYIWAGLMGAARELSGETEDTRLQEVLLHKANKDRVFSAARQAILDDVAKSTKRAKELQERTDWAVPKHCQVPMSNEFEAGSKCLYAPVFEAYFDNDLEREFAAMLDEAPTVKWWVKNGAGGSEHFGIPVGPAKDGELFYPDFVVAFVDGSYGLYDTKAHTKGGSASTEDAKEKSNAVVKYVAEMYAKSIAVDGGLVVRDAARKWRVFRGEKYAWTRELKGWDPLF